MFWRRRKQDEPEPEALDTDLEPTVEPAAPEDPLEAAPSPEVEAAEDVATPADEAPVDDDLEPEVEASPDDWRVWFRLAYAYDIAGDRGRARETMRKAIELHA